MQKRKLILTLFAGLAIMFANDITVKAETETDGAVLLVAPPPFKEQIGPGFNIKKEFSQTSPEGTGEQVVSYARQFLGNPYVYGGISLTEGADCSGFVFSVYQQFGINLPRTSEEQGKEGIDVGGIDYARPGDLVAYIGHVGIYVGQNQVIHASGPEDGIKVSSVDFMPIVSVRRILNN